MALDKIQPTRIDLSATTWDFTNVTSILVPTPTLDAQAATKLYVDSAIGLNNELSEVLANGNTTGGTDIAVSIGDAITFGAVTDEIGGIQNQNLLDKSAAETISGIFTYSAFPVTPSSAPSTDYEVANKKYVDDTTAIETLADTLLSGNVSSGQDLIMSVGDTLTTDTINETGVGTGVTIESVLIKDNTVTATTFNGILGATSSLADGVTATTQIPRDSSTLVATTEYVDDGAWVLPPVEDFFDPTGGLPVAPSVGDRYISDATANGWTTDYIYEWDGDSWVEYPPDEGWMVWMLLELVFYVFFSGGWLEIGEDSFLRLDGSNADSNIDISAYDLITTGAVGRDTDNEINWGVDDSLAIAIGGTTHNIVSITDGAGDNDKLVTQGYVDDQIATVDTWAEILANGNTSGATDVLIDNGQGMVIGHASQITAGSTSELQVLGTDGGGADSSMILGKFNAGASAPHLYFVKSRNGTIGSNTIVQDDDDIGSIRFFPDDGVDYATLAGLFQCTVDDASPAAGDIGVDFNWQQMPGGGGAIRETMRLGADGNLDLAVGGITMGGDVGLTGDRVTKGWFTDLEVTNAIAGSCTGNSATATLASTITVVDSTDATSFIAMFDSATGSLAVKTDAGITYDATAANLATTTFTGALAGNATTATDTASKTGTGSTYATDTSPSFTTPALGTPSALVGTNISGTGAGFTAGAVTNATFTTALTVNTGTLTLTANVANNSVLTIGAGASSVSGSNTGDQSASDFNHDDLANITGTAAQYNHPTDANMTVLGNTSNTNTGDNTVCTSGAATTAETLLTARDIGGVSFDGSASIVPTTIVVADTVDTSCYVGLWESATGSLLPKTDAGITYNAGTAALSTTTFVGALTGQADTVGTITGLAPDTATTQATQANITTCANLTTTGALDAGSITANFGTINNGASAITTTGTVSGGLLTVSQTATSGGSTFTRDLASGSSDSPILTIIQDNAGDDQDALYIQYDPTTGSANAINVSLPNARDNTVSGLRVVTPALDEYTVLMSGQGGMGTNWFYRNIASGSTDSPLVLIEQDNAGDDQPALKIQQDATAGAHIQLQSDTGNTSPTEGDLWRESDGLKYYDGTVEHSLYPEYFASTKDGDLNWATGSTAVTIITGWDASSVEDSAAFSFNVATGVLTVQTAGLYEVGYNAWIQEDDAVSNNRGRAYSWLYLNAGLLKGTGGEAYIRLDNWGTQVGASVIVSLSANDEITLRCANATTTIDGAVMENGTALYAKRLRT